MADASETQAAELPRDIRIILTIQGLRAFAYGFASVLLGVVLAAARFTDLKVGAILTAMLAGMALTSIAVGRWGDRVGRRRLYGSLLALMGVAGGVFALTRWFPALLLAALSGTLSPDPNESGPITSLEQAMIGGVRLSRRVRAFGRYNAVAEERTQPHTAYELGLSKPVDLYSIARRRLLGPLVDAEYGSATFVAATRPATFEVRVSTTGLLARSTPGRLAP